jgi:MarR family transcriptional regulator, organic hydroperoxide resistance regulator
MGASQATSAVASGAGTTGAAEEAWALMHSLMFGERHRFIDAAAEFDLHPAQAGVLMRLRDDAGMSMKEIAFQLRCDNSNVTGLVDRLEARGLVSRRAAEHDRRVKLIVPTERGREVGDQLRARMARPPAALAALSGEDQRALRDLLRRAASGERAPAA